MSTVLFEESRTYVYEVVAVDKAAIRARRRIASRRPFGERHPRFRIEHKGAVRYAVESGGSYRLIDGDVLTEPGSLKRRADAPQRRALS